MKELYEIGKEFLGKYREGNLTKDEINMLHAIIAGLNSKDPSTQVGACIVDKDNNILSLGCNNNPKNWNEMDFPWGNDTKLGEENTKYPYIIHAELDAISKCSNPSEIKDGSIYVTLFPCVHCAKVISSFGIKKVVYAEYRESKEATCSKRLLEKSGIEVINFDEILKNNTKEEKRKKLVLNLGGK